MVSIFSLMRSTSITCATNRRLAPMEPAWLLRTFPGFRPSVFCVRQPLPEPAFLFLVGSGLPPPRQSIPRRRRATPPGLALQHPRPVRTGHAEVWARSEHLSHLERKGCHSALSWLKTRRMGIMCECWNPCRWKKRWLSALIWSVSRVMRRNFFSLANWMVCFSRSVP